jgi:hypothetical protein
MVEQRLNESKIGKKGGEERREEGRGEEKMLANLCYSLLPNKLQS